jgi:metal-sulfur cluster biosynthetic enzyme
VERVLSTAAPAPVASADGLVADVWRAVNRIPDPCSVAMAEPIGIADLGLVEGITVRDGAVEVTLVPTSPHCLYVGLFEQDVEARVRELDWVRSVEVRCLEGHVIWDESRLSETARARLDRRRAALRAELGERDRRARR